MFLEELSNKFIDIIQESLRLHNEFDDCYINFGKVGSLFKFEMYTSDNKELGLIVKVANNN